MSIFSLNWFKSRKEQEIEDLKHEIKMKELQRQLERMENPPAPVQPSFYNPTYNTTWTPVGVGGFEVPNYGAIVTAEPEKPYKSIKLVNDMLTIVLNDGSIISKPGATNDDFQYARKATTEEQLLNLVACQEVVAERKRNEAEVARARAIRQGIEKLAQLDDFRMEGDSVYIVGINRSLPQLLVEEFLVIANRNGFNNYALANDDEFQSLKRFFMWCCLNPRAEVADKLYNFLKKNSFKITKQGFFAALRNVVTLHGSTELVQFVSNAYNKVKAVWKKNPSDYLVFLKDGQYEMINKSMFEELETCTFCDGSGTVPCDDYDEDYAEDGEDSCECPECDGTGTVYKHCEEQYGENLGNLKDLYLDLPNRAENRFTDAHTQTFDIRVGRAVNMDPKACRWNTDDCGAEGLHFTSDEIHYVGCGDQSVLVLINPMKVVGIGESKGRCWEYLPIMTVPRDEATTILHDLDFDTLQLDDSYAIRELEDLTEKAKDGFVAESKKHEFNMPHISTKEIENIVASLDEMKNEISKRIVPLD
jgi:hypothetical protein